MIATGVARTAVTINELMRRCVSSSSSPPGSGTSNCGIAVAVTMDHWMSPRMSHKAHRSEQVTHKEADIHGATRWNPT